jgi:hypothetical protein
VLAEKGVAIKLPRYTFLLDQAIEDDALVHFSGAQVAGWKTGLNMYNQREAQWRGQCWRILSVRRWIDSHIDPKFSYCTRGVEDDRQAVRALRRPFPLEEEKRLVEKAFDDITNKVVLRVSRPASGSSNGVWHLTGIHDFNRLEWATPG